MTEQERLDSGVTEDMIRISVGVEHIDDIILDFKQSFAASDAMKADGKATPENATKTGVSEPVASLSGAS